MGARSRKRGYRAYPCDNRSHAEPRRRRTSLLATSCSRRFVAVEDRRRGSRFDSPSGSSCLAASMGAVRERSQDLSIAMCRRSSRPVAPRSSWCRCRRRSGRTRRPSSGRSREPEGICVVRWRARSIASEHPSSASCSSRRLARRRLGGRGLVPPAAFHAYVSPRSARAHAAEPRRDRLVRLRGPARPASGRPPVAGPMPTGSRG